MLVSGLSFSTNEKENPKTKEKNDKNFLHKCQRQYFEIQTHVQALIDTKTDEVAKSSTVQYFGTHLLEKQILQRSLKKKKTKKFFEK